MRWLADECVAAPLVAFLRTGGHDVLYVAEAAAGFSDSDVLALALREMRLLLTEERISAISSFGGDALSPALC